MTIFCYARNDECFSQSVDVPTIEEAIKVARAELNTEEGDTFYVGEREDIDPALHIDAGDILDDIACRLDDEVGEVADGWPNASAAEMENLTERLRKVIREWIAETGNEPTFWSVRNVQTIQD